MVTAILACEIGFWAVLIAGLGARYGLRMRGLGAVLLAGIPLLDVVLLVIAAIDLGAGGQPTLSHGLAALYLGTSLVFGPQLVRWADGRFAARFDGVQPVKPPRYGAAHAARERRQWLGHLLAYLIAAAVLGLFTALVGDVEKAAALWGFMPVWTLVLGIDFFISFSYTLAPRKPKN